MGMEEYLSAVMARLFVRGGQEEPESYIWRECDADFLSKTVDAALYTIVFESEGVKQLHLNMSELPPLSQRQPFESFWLTRVTDDDGNHLSNRYRCLILFRDCVSRDTSTPLRLLAKYLARVYLSYLHKKVIAYLSTVGPEGRLLSSMHAHAELANGYISAADKDLALFYNPRSVSGTCAPNSVHHALLSPSVRAEIADRFRRMPKRNTSHPGILFLREQRDSLVLYWEALPLEMVANTRGGAISVRSWVDVFSGSKSDLLWESYPDGFLAHFLYFALAFPKSGASNCSMLCEARVLESYCDVLIACPPSLLQEQEEQNRTRVPVITWKK